MLLNHNLLNELPNSAEDVRGWEFVEEVEVTKAGAIAVLDPPFLYIGNL